MSVSVVKSVSMIFAAALLLSACGTISGPHSLNGGGENFAAGSRLAYDLAGGDRDALADAFVSAMASGAETPWRGRNAGGAVTPGDYSLANLKADPRERLILARGDLDIAHRMETDLGLYALTSNANVRTGPGTTYKIATVLSSGSGVEVVGRVVGAPWMLVSHEGRIAGYVHENLMIKAPGTELELAGGPHRRPILCREFIQRIEVFGEADAWTGGACNDGAGWRVAAEPEPKPDEYTDDELLGL